MKKFRTGQRVRLLESKEENWPEEIGTVIGVAKNGTLVVEIDEACRDDEDDTDGLRDVVPDPKYIVPLVNVYVDSAMIKYGRMKMSHMIADSTEELLAMARKIGVPRRWIQEAGTPDEHFDICLSKRNKAIALGAKVVTGKELVKIIRRKEK